MQRILGKGFFSRTADVVAPELIGKFLVREHGGSREAYMITEAEAYDGFEDAASHGAKGRTARTEVMYGPPAHWYVYLIYGMYEMLNIVCGPSGYPAAVLIRGVEGIDGPGKLTRELGITRSFYGKAATKRNGLWIEDRGIVISRSGMLATPRIGVAYAGEWAAKEWRFVITAHEKRKRAPK